MSEATLHLGQTLRFDGDPFVDGLAAARHETRGALLVENGKIQAVGPAADLRAAYPWADQVDHGDGLLLAGFVDAHAHYPQTGIIASWGKRLIDWLNSYTFPEEMRFGDRAYADEVAGRYLDLLLANGTTSVCSYCTIHPSSVDAFFSAAAERNMRVLGGKTCMDRNAPEGLQDDAKSAYDDSRRLLEHWHGRGRASYVITPRFSPTSTPEQLEALGALWAEHPDCLMQTHLSEQLDEIEWVKGLYPQARDYLDTYESFGMLGEKGLYGHAIHLETREKAKLREVGASLIHCPTSNTFIGSGLFDMAGLKSAGQIVGLATDTGGGSSFSMLRSMAAAYEIGQLRGTPLHAAELLWLATAGSARALHLDNSIGNLGVGMEADFIVMNLASTPAIAQRSSRAKDIWETLFSTIMMGDDRAISETYVSGSRVAAKS
ncbi:Guanine deaminase [Pelagimonas phthalicica]|uniref:Guanine deaminase n=1 Tax=Pelagimonas phthalicica TaxID=1037362 RepID=A0A238JC70_9RHOB|nr:guanine deaminase [Pelagimonas phthalicica]TDS93720.1 guanine deaminase [Pelagimonas phthalicica]SMX27757.1 Guanine deaminase [Pelagimonas phthalicica]